MAKVTEYYWKFGELLRKCLPSDMDQASLAAQLKVHRSAVGRWLNDGGRPDNPDVVLQIAKILELDELQTTNLLEAADYKTTADYIRDAGQKPPSKHIISADAEISEPSELHPMFHAITDAFNKAIKIPGVREVEFVFKITIAMVLLAVMLIGSLYGGKRLIEYLSSVRVPTKTPTLIVVPLPYPTELVPTVVFTPTATLVPTLDFFGATPVAIPSAGINIRSGPGTEYEIVQASQSGDRLVLIGKSPDGTWWNVELNGISGWVLGELVTVQNSEGVPVVVNFPPLPATFTPQPTPVTATQLPPTEAATPSPTETVGQQTTEPALGTQTLASFSKINFSAPGNLLLVQEATSSITIDAPENVLSAIYFRVEGSTLLIGTTSPVQIANASIQYRVSTPNIDTIVAAGTGDIRADNMKADILNLTSGGTGAIDFETLSARVVFVNIIGTGDIVISSGNAVEENVNIAGTGDFSAGNLKSDKAIIYIGGTGDATVWVNAQLEATITGTGTIRYYGSPAVSQNIAELGEIESLGPK